MNRYEEAKSEARKLDILYPQFYHMVGVNYQNASEIENKVVKVEYEGYP